MRNSNITKNRIRVALLLVLAASIIGLGPAFSASARAGSFSINDVSGNYVELADGWTFGNGVVNFDPVSQVGLVTFTPATGTFHEDLIIRNAGTNLEVHPNGTYRGCERPRDDDVDGYERPQAPRFLHRERRR